MARSDSLVCVSTGVELKVRLPTGTALNAVSAGAEPARPSIRVIRPPLATGAAVQSPLVQRKQKARAEEEAWAARTRRRASRGIARAVAAVRRAEDSDSFESEEEEPPPPTTTANMPKRGRGRPRKAGGFSCQLCSRRLESQAEFFQHLRDHYEKPDGEEAAPAAESAAVESSEAVLEPISEEAELGGAGDGPAVLNVDIIAAEAGGYECDECDLAFFSEDELDKHKKTHIEVLTKAEIESEVEVGEGMEEAEAELVAEAEATAADPPSDMRQLIQSGDESEPPAPDTDAATADQYEMKNLKKCTDCRKVFTTLASLRNHRQRMHGAGGPVSATNAAKHEYECEQCHVTYTSHKIYERHRRLHQDKAAGRLPHRCTACGVSFLTSMLLAHHVQKEHAQLSRRPAARRPSNAPPRPNGRPPGSSNKDRQAVYNQIEELENGMFRCLVCDFHGKTKSQLFYHVSIKHKGELLSCSGICEFLTMCDIPL